MSTPPQWGWMRGSTTWSHLRVERLQVGFRFSGPFPLHSAGVWRVGIPLPILPKWQRRVRRTVASTTLSGGEVEVAERRQAPFRNAVRHPAGWSVYATWNGGTAIVGFRLYPAIGAERHRPKGESFWCCREGRIAGYSRGSPLFPAFLGTPEEYRPSVVSLAPF